MEDQKRDQVLKLIEEKIQMENDLRAQHEILKTNNVGMSEPLVDNEGFPRSDIDVYQVRHARHKICCLQNDLRKIFKQIENGLTDVHAQQASHPPAPRAAIVSSSDMIHADNVPPTPFAMVTLVDNGSPADIAGLCKNDKIIQFGSVTSKNFTAMDQVYSIVSHSVGQALNVQVMRGSLIVGVTLVPKPWSNRGLLGCHIQKIDAD